MQFKAIQKFTTTEGGPLPGTIEAAAPYTPVNVSMFVANLNSGDNNLQALADAVDRRGADLIIHGHAHHGVELGQTEKGIPVRNVALPVLRSYYVILELGD